MKSKFNRAFGFIFLFIIALCINSCKKDQSAVRKLDGTWEVESVTYPGQKPTELFIMTDFSKGATPCTVGTYEKIIKIWFYKCRLETEVDCDWIGAPAQCDPTQFNWCTGNVRFPYDPNGCGGKGGDGNTFISFEYRVEQKGKKLYTKSTGEKTILAYDILFLNNKKAILEYKTDTLKYTVTLKSMKDDKP